MKLSVSGLFGFCKIEISKNEIHYQTGGSAGPITVALQQTGDGGYVFSSFQRVEIVRMLSEPNPVGAKLFVTLAIAHAHASPVITLEDHQRARER